ncbi:Stk1 family PASTA domain-containing Ser/Thr kinase [Longivirga aurantiaca]|uniref:non-specific serine/threonine protein kinase n=1 Tax=Longivirga aurantiaca TaxID=1837743 RepID=A0ABW1T227_9ACTN
METSAGTRSTDALVGRVIDGRYRVDARLARGGMATVYEALDLRLDRVVALKVMHASLADDATFVSRFQREAKSAARLSDPHVVAVYDQGEDGDLVYLAMEYVPGRTVRDVLREHGKLSAEQALTILDPVLQALEAAHRAGFVHRDVKPENVLLTDDGRVKVADFGLARAISAATSSAATQGLLIGTVAYLSPEQVERGVADARSDVYGAGILLYEMVTGTVPFAGETPLSVAYQHVNAAVPVPSSIRAGIAPAIDALVARSTARDPDNRYADAAGFLQDVREAKRALPVPRPFGVVDDSASAATLIVPLATDALPGEYAPAGAQAAYRGDTPPPDKPAKAKGPKRKRRKGPIALLIVLLLAAGVAGGAWYLGVGKTVQVPTVAGLTEKQAQAKLAPLGLTLAVGDEAFSETVAAGDIIATDPDVGTDVREGSTVTAVVSKGPERYEVPQVAGMSLTEATAAIEDSSLVVGTVTKDWSEKVKKDLVISSSPKSTTSLKKGQEIDLVLSKGPAPVKIPSLSGQTKDAATSALTGAGLKVKYAEDYSKKVAEGRVISSNPKSGTTVPKGSTVTLVISKGPPLVEMPDLFRTDEQEAVKALKALGLKVTVTYPIGFTPFGRVVEQSVKAGTQIPWGTTVQINVV